MAQVCVEQICTVVKCVRLEPGDLALPLTVHGTLGKLSNIFFFIK